MMNPQHHPKEGKMNTHRTRVQNREAKGTSVIAVFMVLIAIAFGIYAWQTMMPNFLDFLSYLQGTKKP